MRREQTPEIDVIITVYKPDERFGQLLVRLHHQSLPPARILVINTDRQYWSDRWTEGIPEAEVFHVSKREYDHAGTRRMGAELSTAEYMVFMTMDALPADRNLLSLLYRVMVDKEVAVAYARQLPNRGCHPVDACIRGFNYPKESRKKTKKDIETLGIRAFFCSDVCAIYRKSDYLFLGGFPDHAIFNEDMIFARKVLDAGKAVYYAAEARVYHSHNDTAMQQLHRNFDLAVSQRQNPQSFGDIISESEGIRVVKRAAAHFVRTGKWYLLPSLIGSSAAKYIGFFLGSHYNRLPKKWILFLTGNIDYWRRNGFS